MQDPLGPLVILATNSMFTDPAIDLVEPEPVDSDSDDGEEDPSNAPLSARDMLARYRTTRDRSVLRMLPGASPTEFTIKRLQAAYVLSVLRQLPESTRIVLAVCGACHEVKLPDGKVLKPKQIKPSSTYGVRLAEEREWIHTLVTKFGMDTVEEIGRTAIALASLPEGAKGPFV